MPADRGLVARSHRPGRAPAIQRSGNGRRVRGRPDSGTNEGGDADREGERTPQGQPKLNPRQEGHLVELHGTGEYSTAELADLFSVGRSTVYRAIKRARRAHRDGYSEASA
ncbi:site-specific recombinase [Rhodococcus opacus B4]|uniref:Site-specific recombinase n=1 Tax=Rhodococcus opacus (strain B4) TaxID=632772 RepID=C1B836_RHOOB|nr:site-specific recombinase [Rhodococcus opacus B4]